MSSSSPLTDDISILLAPLDRMSTNSPRDSSGATSAPASVAHGGESGESGTLLGQVKSVHSVEDSPAYHSTAQEHIELPTQVTVGKQAKKFKLFMLKEEDLEQLCGGIIGQGETFCLRQACPMTHKSGRAIEKEPGQVYVAKTTTAAFMTPTINVSKIPAELREQWMIGTNTLNQWNNQFLIVGAMDTVDSPTGLDFKYAEDFVSKALTFRTPAKRARDDVTDSPVPIPALAYQAQLGDTPEGESPRNIIGDVETLNRIVRGLDQGLVYTNASLRVLGAEYEQLNESQAESIAKLNLKTEATAAQLGTKPDELSDDFDSPNLWGTLAAVADVVDTLKAQSGNSGTVIKSIDHFETELHRVDLKQTLFDKDLKDIRNNILQNCHLRQDQTDLKLNDAIQKLVAHIVSVKGELTRSVNRLHQLEQSNQAPPFSVLDVDSMVGEEPQPKRRREDLCKDLRDRLDEVEDKQTEFKEIPKRLHAVEKRQQELNTMGERLSRAQAGNRNSNPTNTLDSLLDRVKKLEAVSEDHAVAFANLGIASHEDAAAWLDTHCPSGDVHLLPDAHMVFEHIYRQSSRASSDTLRHMENMARIKTRNLGDATALASFDTRVPKVLASSDSTGVVKSDQSFFDLVKTYEQWSYPSTGVKDKITTDLEEFSITHGQMIGDSFGHESKFYFVATQALTLSVAWVSDFMRFIDEYYKELSKAKFGANKAWHVTTRIAKRILLDVSLPRVGARNNFSVVNPEETTHQIFWSVIRSHDEMAAFKNYSFRNHPSVASELVKFLAVNTGYEIVERLQTQMTQVLTDVSALQKTSTSSSKAAQTATNKADDTKKELDALKKRFDTLIKKNPTLQS